MKWASLKDLAQTWHGLPILVWVALAGVGLYLLTKFRSSMAASSGTMAASTSGTETITPTSSGLPSAYSTISSMPGVVISQNGTVLTSYDSRQAGYVHSAPIGVNPGGPALA